MRVWVWAWVRARARVLGELDELVRTTGAGLIVAGRCAAAVSAEETDAAASTLTLAGDADGVALRVAIVTRCDRCAGGAEPAACALRGRQIRTQRRWREGQGQGESNQGWGKCLRPYSISAMEIARGAVEVRMMSSLARGHVAAQEASEARKASSSASAERTEGGSEGTTIM